MPCYRDTRCYDLQQKADHDKKYFATCLSAWKALQVFALKRTVEDEECGRCTCNH